MLVIGNVAKLPVASVVFLESPVRRRSQNEMNALGFEFQSARVVAIEIVCEVCFTDEELREGVRSLGRGGILRGVDVSEVRIDRVGHEPMKV